MKIEEKLDKIIDKQETLNITVAKQEVNLREHMRRTEILEEKLEPVETHVVMVKGAFKLLVAIGIIAGIYRSVM